jgi:uncharacterized protein with GYD domain
VRTYINLIRWTQKGIENIKDSPNWVDAFRQAVEAAGGELKAAYLVQGQYDMVTIAELPGGEAQARVALSLASNGALRTETLHGFPEDEFRKIIASLP